MKFKYQGQSYEFPDDSSIEEINSTLGIGQNTPQNNTKMNSMPPQPFDRNAAIEQYKNITGMNRPGIGGNFIAGMLNSGASLLRSLPNIRGMSNIPMPEPLANNFDAYKAMGATDQPFYTPGGAVQLAGELYAPGKAASKLIEPAKNVLNYLRPNKSANAFLENLSGKTAEENTQQIANAVKNSAETQKAEALAHKENVMSQVGKTNVTQLPGFDVKKVIALFEKDPSEINKNQIQSLEKARREFLNDQDFDKFIKRSESIFNSDLPENSLDKLENMISPRKTHYEGNEEIFSQYDKQLKRAHEKYMQNKTFENADDVMKKLNERIYDKTLKLNDKDKWRDYVEAKKDLLRDMDSHVEGQSPEVKNEYKNFRTKWATNVEPHFSNKILERMANGENEGIKPTEIRSVFAHPKKDVRKVLEFLPSETKNHILYNELTQANLKKPIDLVNALSNLEKHKGYSKYITPEITEFKNQLAKQIRYSNLAKYGVGTLAVLGGLGATGHHLNALHAAHAVGSAL